MQSAPGYCQRRNEDRERKQTVDDVHKGINIRTSGDKVINEIYNSADNEREKLKEPELAAARSAVKIRVVLNTLDIA